LASGNIVCGMFGACSVGWWIVYGRRWGCSVRRHDNSNELQNETTWGKRRLKHLKLKKMTCPYHPKCKHVHVVYAGTYIDTSGKIVHSNQGLHEGEMLTLEILDDIVFHYFGDAKFDIEDARNDYVSTFGSCDECEDESPLKYTFEDGSTSTDEFLAFEVLLLEIGVNIYDDRL